MNGAGEPRRIQVGRDGGRIVHLLGDRLCVFDAAAGLVREVAANVADYSCDRLATVAAYTVQGQIFRVRLTGDGDPESLGIEGEQPQPDPTGRHLAFRRDRAIYVLPDGAETPALLAGEEPADVCWGGLDGDAAGFGRHRGWWWAPDGSAILAVRSDGSHNTSLHLLELDGGWVDVHWDRWIYPYVATVGWDDGPLLTVLRRSQNHGLVLAVDPRTGETQVHAELSDPRFVRTVEGTPRHLADGRVLVGSEIAHESYDARCLFADGTLLTPPNLYVRRVVGKLGPGALDAEMGDLLVEASTDPAEQHLYRVRGALGRASGITAHRLTHEPGWHTAECGGSTVVVGSSSLDYSGTRWTVLHHGTPVGSLGNPSAATAYNGNMPRPALDRVTDRRLPVGVLYPPRHLLGRRVPVLLDLPAQLGEQGVVARSEAWQDREAWAEAGFAVITVDTRGSTGVAPSFEKVVHRRLADIMVADLAETVQELGTKDPDLDLSHVLLRGTGIGGWLAAFALRERPEVFHGAAIRAPIRSWEELPPVVGERYLGNREDNDEVWIHHELDDLPEGVVELAPQASTEDEVAALRTLLM
jgi:dipeptidyl-peptidase 4